MMEAMEPLGVELAQRLLAAMQIEAAAIEGYGKGAIIGLDGELEHGPLWHVPGGYAMRELLEGRGVAPRRSCRRTPRSAGRARASTFR